MLNPITNLSQKHQIQITINIANIQIIKLVSYFKNFHKQFLVHKLNHREIIKIYYFEIVKKNRQKPFSRLNHHHETQSIWPGAVDFCSRSWSPKNQGKKSTINDNLAFMQTLFPIRSLWINIRVLLVCLIIPNRRENTKRKTESKTSMKMSWI